MFETTLTSWWEMMPDNSTIKPSIEGKCWIHEARHYEKLSPVIPIHQQWLDEFLEDFWAYYYQLKDYRQRTPEQRQLQFVLLAAEFDRLFSQVTGYDDLDHRLSLTRRDVALSVVSARLSGSASGQQ